MVWLGPSILLAFVLGMVALSERVGRLRVRPQDAPVVRWYAKGLLHGLVWPIAVGMLGQVFVATVIQGGAIPLGPALFPLASLVAVAIGHWRLERLQADGPVDARLQRTARVVLGAPMAIVAMGCLGVFAILAGFPLAQQVPGLSVPLLQASAMAVTLGSMALALSAPFFLTPALERQPDGTLGSVPLAELKRRWVTFGVEDPDLADPPASSDPPTPSPQRDPRQRGEQPA